MERMLRSRLEISPDRWY